MGNTWKLCNLSFITLTHTIKKRAFKLSLVALNHANRIEVFYDHISVLKEAWTILSWIWNWLPIIYLPLFQALGFPFLNPRVWASFKDTLREEICITILSQATMFIWIKLAIMWELIFWIHNGINYFSKEHSYFCIHTYVFTGEKV